MKKTHTIHRKASFNLQFLSFGILAIIGSFLMGIETAGDVRTFERSEAVSLEASVTAPVKPGDMNENGVLDVHDVIAILEIDQGYTEPSVKDLEKDTDGDHRISAKDALRVLHSIALH